MSIYLEVLIHSLLLGVGVTIAALVLFVGATAYFTARDAFRDRRRWLPD